MIKTVYDYIDAIPDSTVLAMVLIVLVVVMLVNGSGKWRW